MPYQEVPPKIKKGDQNLSQRQKSTSTVANFMSRTLSKTELIIIHNTVNTRISRISVGGGVIRGGGGGKVGLIQKLDLTRPKPWLIYMYTDGKEP